MMILVNLCVSDSFTYVGETERASRRVKRFTGNIRDREEKTNEKTDYKLAAHALPYSFTFYRHDYECVCR